MRNDDVKEEILAELSAHKKERLACHDIAKAHGIKETELYILIGNTKGFRDYCNYWSVHMPQEREYGRVPPAKVESWWTAGNTATVQQLHNNGMSVVQIASKLRRSADSIKYGLRKIQRTGRASLTA